MSGIGAILKGVLIPQQGLPIPIPFLYNPSEVTETRTVNYAETDAPGPSHPGIQYVNGKGREISLTLEAHDPFLWRGVRLPMILELYIASLHRLTLPTYLMGELFAGPPTVRLILGAMVRDTKIKSMTIVSKQWTKWMRLKHVQIQLTLAEVVDESQTRGLLF